MKGHLMRTLYERTLYERTFVERTLERTFDERTLNERTLDERTLDQRPVHPSPGQVTLTFFLPVEIYYGQVRRTAPIHVVFCEPIHLCHFTNAMETAMNSDIG